MKENLEKFNLDRKIIKILKENNINIIEDVWNLKRKDLKSLGLSDSEIKQIIIILELLGFGLNKKVYKSYRN